MKHIEEKQAGSEEIRPNIRTTEQLVTGSLSDVSAARRSHQELEGRRRMYRAYLLKAALAFAVIGAAVGAVEMLKNCNPGGSVEEDSSVSSLDDSTGAPSDMPYDTIEEDTRPLHPTPKIPEDSPHSPPQNLNETPPVPVLKTLPPAQRRAMGDVDDDEWQQEKV